MSLRLSVSSREKCLIEQVMGTERACRNCQANSQGSNIKDKFQLAVQGMQNSRDLLILLRQIRQIQGIKVMTSAEDTEQKSRSDLVWTIKSGQRCLQSPVPGSGPAATVEMSFLRWGHGVNLPQLHSKTSCGEEEWEVLLFFPLKEFVQGTLSKQEVQGMLQRNRQAASTHLS